MLEMKECYTGDRVIKLNRNEKNIGITEHLEKIYSLASHDWVVRMDGDDRSLPHRCRMIAEAIIQYPHAVYIVSDVVKVVCKCAGQAIFSQIMKDDRLKAFMPEEGTTRKAFLGTSSAIKHASRAPYSEIRDLAMCEDLYEAHRVWLNEQLVVVDNTLVLYVEHESNMSRINPEIKNGDIKSFFKCMERLKRINQSFIQANEAIVCLTEKFLQSCTSSSGSGTQGFRSQKGFYSLA